MNRNRTQHYADEANLQADVMRFMAIIAFCLVAILAIVRNVEPTSTTEVIATRKQAPSPSPEQKSDVASSKKYVAVLKPYAPPTPNPAQLAETGPTLETSPPPVESQSKPEISKEELEETASKAEPKSKPEPEPEPEPDSIPAADAGLALRFASDSDFLRLLNKGTVTLYAISENGYQSYDTAHRFVPTDTPKQYYEVIATTVPPLVSNLLQGKSVTWAVRLPPEIEQQISSHIERDSSGELLINRFAEVRHVSAR